LAAAPVTWGFGLEGRAASSAAKRAAFSAFLRSASAALALAASALALDLAGGVRLW
jgi:hypothetical protein